MAFIKKTRDSMRRQNLESLATNMAELCMKNWEAAPGLSPKTAFEARADKQIMVQYFKSVLEGEDLQRFFGTSFAEKTSNASSETKMFT